MLNAVDSEVQLTSRTFTMTSISLSAHNSIAYSSTEIWLVISLFIVVSQAAEKLGKLRDQQFRDAQQHMKNQSQRLYQEMVGKGATRMANTFWLLSSNTASIYIFLKTKQKPFVYCLLICCSFVCRCFCRCWFYWFCRCCCCCCCCSLKILCWL